ncbi:hypothetical protein ACWY4P_53880 (plasmid) [Streptomyces sp. LZ34]
MTATRSTAIAVVGTLAGAITAHVIHTRAASAAIQVSAQCTASRPAHRIVHHRHQGAEQQPAHPAIPLSSAAKPVTAEGKILAALAELAELKIHYAHRDTISYFTDLEGSTRDNTLSRLVKEGKIHRQTQDGKVIRGMYGLGSAPRDDDSRDN